MELTVKAASSPEIARVLADFKDEKRLRQVPAGRQPMINSSCFL
jgi:hypothetical protein